MQRRPGAPSEGGRDSRPKVLIVDDDAAFCAGIRRVLSESEDGFDVRCASDCFEAGFQLGTFRPDVVILDLVMPGLSGLAICDRIRRHATLRNVKIVVLTGFPGGGNRERAVIGGADLFLEKPQPPAALVEYVRDLTSP